MEVSQQGQLIPIEILTELQTHKKADNAPDVWQYI